MIWLIGNKGMLGTELASALAAAGLPAVGTDRVRCETRRMYPCAQRRVWGLAPVITGG